MARIILGLWLAVALALPAAWVAVAAEEKACQSEREVLGDATLEFLLFQQAAAGFCDSKFSPGTLTGLGPLGELILELQKKHRDEFIKLGGARQDYFRRVHGDSWRQELRKADGELAFHLLNVVRLDQVQCERFGEELKTLLDGSWSYLQTKLEETAKEKQSSARLCE